MTTPVAVSRVDNHHQFEVHSVDRGHIGNRLGNPPINDRETRSVDRGQRANNQFKNNRFSDRDRQSYTPNRQPSAPRPMHTQYEERERSLPGGRLHVNYDADWQRYGYSRDFYVVSFVWGIVRRLIFFVMLFYCPFYCNC